MTKETKETFKVTQQPPAGYKKLNDGKRVADNIYGPAFQTIFHYLLPFKDEKGEIMEFGTFHGYSSALIAQLMKRLRMTQNHLHLFDSFTGLPDIDNPIDRTHYEVSKGTWFKGQMDLSKIPQIENIIFRELTEIISPDQLSIVTRIL